MPRGDRTGPVGMGPRTGRAVGYCSGAEVPGFANPVAGRGFGMGFGRGRGAWSGAFGRGGRGWRNMFYATGLPGWMRFGSYAAPFGDLAQSQAVSPEFEKKALKNQAEALQSELDFIKKRLGEIESKPAAE